jgi:hypothetical protein
MLSVYMALTGLMPPWNVSMLLLVIISGHEMLWEAARTGSYAWLCFTCWLAVVAILVVEKAVDVNEGHVSTRQRVLQTIDHTPVHLMARRKDSPPKLKRVIKRLLILLTFFIQVWEDVKSSVLNFKDLKLYFEMNVITENTKYTRMIISFQHILEQNHSTKG